MRGIVPGIERQREPNRQGPGFLELAGWGPDRSL